MSREEYLTAQITKIQNDFDKLAKEIQDDGNACTKTMFSEYVAFELEKAFKDFEDKENQALKAKNAELKARLAKYEVSNNIEKDKFLTNEQISHLHISQINNLYKDNISLQKSKGMKGD